jgi:succinate dehydrogenase/fumarate reductase flavoprotein subunit
MAQGGYSGKAPSAEQAQQRTEQNKASEQRITAEVENKCNERITTLHEQHNLEMAAVRERLAQVESERVMLLRILDAYAAAVTELQALKGEPQIRGGE